MDAQRKKQLLLEYKERRPEKGVISYRCTSTGEAFLDIATDTKARFNSINIKLGAGSHPNRRMQQLWDEHGAAGFERSVIRVLEYENPRENHLPKLEELRDECLAEDERAVKMWL